MAGRGISSRSNARREGRITPRHVLSGRSVDDLQSGPTPKWSSLRARPAPWVTWAHPCNRAQHARQRNGSAATAHEVVRSLNAMGSAITQRLLSTRKRPQRAERLACAVKILRPHSLRSSSAPPPRYSGTRAASRDQVRGVGGLDPTSQLLAPPAGRSSYAVGSEYSTQADQPLHLSLRHVKR